MPYIKSDNNRREELRNGDTSRNAGELNYQIFYYIKHTDLNENSVSKIENQVKTYVNNFLNRNPNYQRYNDMTGCLIRCGKELVRRLGNRYYFIENLLRIIMDSYDKKIEDYENIKIAENGDVE